MGAVELGSQLPLQEVGAQVIFPPSSACDFETLRSLGVEPDV